MSYKIQIEKALQKSGWDITLIDKGDDWWESEYWIIQPSKGSFESQLFITFIVDPMYATYESRDKHIYEIAATDRRLIDRMDLNRTSSICMSKRKFNEKLKEFIDALANYKRHNLT